MKNIAKSIFISTFPVLGLIVFIKTIINSKFHLNDIGLLVSSASIVLFFALLFIKPVARTSRGLALYSSLVFIGLVLNFIDIENNKLLIAVGLAVGWLLYLVWYSNFNKRDKSILIKGKTLPACLLYTSPSPRDRTRSRMPSSA